MRIAPLALTLDLPTRSSRTADYSGASKYYDATTFYRASAGLHDLTGDFFRSSSFTKKSIPGVTSTTVVPFKKPLLQLCVLQLPAHVTHSPVWNLVSQAQIAFDGSAGSTVHFALRHSAHGVPPGHFIKRLP